MDATAPWQGGFGGVVTFRGSTTPPPEDLAAPALAQRAHLRQVGLLDCTFSEFERALSDAFVIEEHALSAQQLKELVLTVEWVRPLHVIVVVDDARREERIVTVYEPTPRRWSQDYRRRR